MEPHVNSEVVTPPGQGHHGLQVENRVVPRCLTLSLLGLLTSGGDLSVDSIGDCRLGDSTSILDTTKKEVQADDLHIIIRAVVVVSFALDLGENRCIEPLDITREPGLQLRDQVLRP